MAPEELPDAKELSADDKRVRYAYEIDNLQLASEDIDLGNIFGEVKGDWTDGTKSFSPEVLKELKDVS